MPAAPLGGDPAAVITTLADALAAAGRTTDPADLARAALDREAKSATGLPGGIAIPHARLPGVARPLGLFARLRPAVDFDAIDGERVDLAFLLLLPAPAQPEHLNVLALVARRLRADGVRAELRRAPRGANGPVVRMLCAPCAVRTTGSLRLTAREVRWLRADVLYVQVTTRRDPAGYARAQLTGA